MGQVFTPLSKQGGTDGYWPMSPPLAMDHLNAHLLNSPPTQLATHLLVLQGPWANCADPRSPGFPVAGGDKNWKDLMVLEMVYEWGEDYESRMVSILAPHCWPEGLLT